MVDKQYSRSEKTGEYEVEYLKWLANPLNLPPCFLRHNIIMALLLIARQPTLILSWHAWPTQRNSWITWEWSKFALQLICNYINLPCRSCGLIQKVGKTLHCDLELCTHCPCAWVPLVLLWRGYALKNISRQPIRAYQKRLMEITGNVMFADSTWCLLVWFSKVCFMLCIQITLLNSKRPWLLPYRGQVSHQREGCG